MKRGTRRWSTAILALTLTSGCLLVTATTAVAAGTPGGTTDCLAVPEYPGEVGTYYPMTVGPYKVQLYSGSPLAGGWAKITGPAVATYRVRIESSNRLFSATDLKSLGKVPVEDPPGHMSHGWITSDSDINNNGGYTYCQDDKVAPYGYAFTDAMSGSNTNGFGRAARACVFYNGAWVCAAAWYVDLDDHNPAASNRTHANVPEVGFGELPNPVPIPGDMTVAADGVRRAQYKPVPSAIERREAIPAWVNGGPARASLSGDGRAELVRINDQQQLTSFTNLGGFPAWPWSSTTVIVGTGWPAAARVRFADLDGNGKKELINVQPDGYLAAWDNHNTYPAWPWTRVATVGTGWYDPARVRFADLNGDGRDDLVNIQPDGKLHSWRNSGTYPTWMWSVEADIGTGWDNPERVRFADLNGDGRDELIDIRADGTLNAWTNTGNYPGWPWSTASTPVGGGFTDAARVRFADLNGDGRDELIQIRTDGTLHAWLNNGAYPGWPWGTAAGIGGGWTPGNTIFA